VMQRPHPSRADTVLDYSPEAIKGRITIHNLPSSAREEEIRELLRPFGRLIYFRYPETSKSIRYAFAKLESNEKADAAVASLDRIRMGGNRVRVKRADYWHGIKKEIARDLPRFGCYTEPHPTFARAAKFETEGMVDSDDEADELMDNLSSTSFFSVD
ncbi:hypothetical protein PMAYCL1PPCAC_13806, partial [Pristionchus mayeri]